MNTRLVRYSDDYCTDHHKDLLEPANCPHVPGRLEVDAVGVATNQVFGQDHDEALKQNIGVLSSSLYLLIQVDRSKPL